MKFIPPTLRSLSSCPPLRSSSSREPLPVIADDGSPPCPAGHHVIASGRKPAELAKVKQEAGAAKLGHAAARRHVDASIEAAVLEVDRSPVDAASTCSSNNAGFACSARLGDPPSRRWRRQYETQRVGLMNVTRAFLPKMRERRSAASSTCRASVAASRCRSSGLQLDEVRGREPVERCLRAASVRHRRRPHRTGASSARTSKRPRSRTSARSRRPRTPSRSRSTSRMSKFADKFASNPIVIRRRSRARSRTPPVGR